MESFFPCDTCSKHFGSMAAEDDARVVQSPDDALLWSWSAHNRVSAQQGACRLNAPPSLVLDAAPLHLVRRYFSLCRIG
jgi:Erv1 / Alr family